MQQYIYGNLHHAGFRTVSSDTIGFFTNHADVLSPLMYYDTKSTHGELKAGQHKCFWMLTTDLKITGGRDYLFVQESGMDPYRDAAVVQGYRSDYDDGDLYGPAFLELFGTRFVSNQEAMKAGEDESLCSLPFAQLPREDVAPEPIPRDLLQAILLALFRKKRVIIRIPCQGAEAMARSRNYLKAIYQCLPYEKRRNNGCITSATEKMLGISNAFRICLMDADVDTADISTDSYQSFFDMKTGATNVRHRESDAPYLPLVEFLTDASQQEREGFFQYCREALREDGITGEPDMEGYAVLLSEYRLGNTTLSGREIAYWAESLCNKDRSEERKLAIGKKIVAALPVANLLAYLQEEARDYASINRFGMLQDTDEEARDENAALTLRMMVDLPEYDCNTVQAGMVAHFVSLAKQTYPVLAEEKPEKDAVKACMELPKPKPHRKRIPWTNALMEAVKTELDAAVDQVKARYENHYSSQKADGDAKINAFAGWELETLYNELQKHYLYPELIGGWNQAVGQKVVGLCSSWPDPLELDGYSRMLEQLHHLRKIFAANAGTLTKAQEQTLRELEKKWNDVPTLAARSCKTARELDRWIREADTVDCHPALRDRMKRNHVNALLARIPEELDLAETTERLQCAVTYGNLLEDSKVTFEPWGIKAEPRMLLDQIGMLKNYPNAGMPKLNNKKLRGWIVRELPENKDLMILLICRYPEKQAERVSILARKGRGITPSDIRSLYLAGCPRSLLCGQSGQGASGQWRSAVEACLPELPELPEPMKPQISQMQTKQKVLALAAQILLGLAALIPGVVLLLTGSGSVGVFGVFVAVMVLFAAGFGVAASLPKAKPVRSVLMGLALAMIPGILAGAAGLILSFL